MATFDEFYESLDPYNNVRGDQFEKKFVIWFLQNDPTWSSQIEDLWKWEDYPKRAEWGIDCGVDLVLHHVNGERWAIQAKCFSPDEYLNKAELNSFIAESSDNRFQGRLLISSTNKIGPNADRLLKRHKVVRILLKDLRDADINYPSSIKKLNEGSRVKRFNPKPHQITAINDVVENLRYQNKGQVLMACGSGKTLTALWIKERLLAKNTLVLVPSLSLLRQTIKNWNTHKNKSFKWLCVCSDITVAKDKKKKDEWITNTSELDISVTSDIKKIKEFICLEGDKVIFSTYQSSDLICEINSILKEFSFDLTIADEAHNCTGRTDTYFGNILNDEKIRTTKKLFFTATPRILSKRIKTASLQHEIDVASMDDKSLFGEVFHKLNFSEAIKKKILSDYQVSIVGVENKQISEMIRVRKLIQTYKDYHFDAETLGIFISLIKSIENYNLRKLITFHNLIEHANLFSQIFPLITNYFKKDLKENLTFDSDFVSGKMTANEKDEKIQKLNLANEKSCFILSNSRCLSEGVDVPSLDGVAFIDPKHSPIDIVQAVGRAIRKSEGKTKGTIIIPVFLDEIEDVDEQILATKFSTVWSVILALKSQDDELLEKIDNLRIELGSKKVVKITSKGLEKIHFDLPKNINPEFYESLYTRLVENTSDDWLELFGQLKAYKEKFGHVLPSKRENKLGVWCTTQRIKNNKGILSRDRIELLNSIEFVWDPLEEEWQSNFQELKKFYEINGHSNPPTKGHALGGWCISQRGSYKKGFMSTEHENLLNSINFIWNRFDEIWESKYRELKKFRNKYGHASPKKSEDDLNVWCMTQRTKRRKGSLSEDRINLLDKINFVWDIDEEEWQKKYEDLKLFKEKNGHTNAPSGKNSLGNWCQRQRTLLRKKELSQERKKLLDRIEFVWDPYKEEWQKQFNDLVEFKKINGHSNPAATGSKGSILGIWCSRQRVSFKKKELSQEKIHLLNKLDFQWDPVEEEWQKQFNDLKEFKRIHGHSSPNSNKFILGRWCQSQRSNYKKGKLSQDKINLLNKLDFQWDPIEEEWQKQFNDLVEFKKINGHASPPTRGSELSRWCVGQRSRFRDNKLRQDRIDLLDDLGFVWNTMEKTWEDKFNELKAYKEKHGHSNPVAKTNLGKWCSDQKERYKSKKLSQERIDLLNSLDFVWDVLDYEWHKKFEKLKDFKKLHGHASPNSKRKEFASLGKWCLSQRSNQRKGKLSQERFDLLGSIGFSWD